jgi:hypothetical protein
MSDSWVLWILTAASALHVLEEHAMGWQGWAAGALGPRFGVHPRWSDFWSLNAALIVLAIACASTGWGAPAFALALPAVCLINAIFFHILPSGMVMRPNPGLFTAVLLYLPISLWAYAAAAHDAQLNGGTVILSMVIGAAITAFAIFLLIAGRRAAYPDQPPA